MQQNPQNSITGWFFTEDQIVEAITKGYMLNPSIDLSNPCNLNCPYCYIEEKNSQRKLRKPNEMTLEETIQVIKDFYDCGAKTVNIVGAGEPTVDPHFVEIVQKIVSLGMTTVLFTNGIQLCNQPKLINFLYSNDVSVVLKYNSQHAEIQDLVAGRKDYTKKRNKSLELLIDAGFTSYQPTRLGLDIIVFKGNLSEIPEIHYWCRKNNIYPIAGEFIPTGRTENGEFQGYKSLFGFNKKEIERISELLQPINSSERRELLINLKELDENFGIQRTNNFAYVGGGICTQIIGLYVDIEGNIYPCVARSQINGKNISNGLLGNIKKGDSSCEIWLNNYYMQKVRQNFSGGCPYKSTLSIEILK